VGKIYTLRTIYNIHNKKTIASIESN